MTPRVRVLVVVVAVLSTACGARAAPVPASSLAAVGPEARSCPFGQPGSPTPTGELRVGYPDEPVAWHPPVLGDVAAADLAALWGLPLYRHDRAGQLVPVLVQEAVVLGHGGGGWQVRLRLCQGEWTDGEPVVAQDVVSTVEAVRATPLGASLRELVEVAADGPDVVVTFAESSGRWQHVLADLGTILPAHVLAEQGLGAWEDALPVTGGPFRLEAAEGGRVRTFVAHPASAAGAPRTERLDVLVVPRFELALGLLEQGDLDVALGHLALEAEPRIADLDGLQGEAARGGTILTLRWQDTDLTDEDRTRLLATLDLGPFAQGLLDGQGGVVRSFVQDVAGPDRPPRRRVDDVREVVVAAPRWHEAPSLLARAIRDGIERMGGTVRTTSDEADVLARMSLGDAHVVIRRPGPWPSLAGFGADGGVDPELSTWSLLVAADRAEHRFSPEVAEAVALVAGLPRELPLVAVPVAHAWRDQVSGVVPSGHPGIGFTSAVDWSGGG